MLFFLWYNYRYKGGVKNMPKYEVIFELTVEVEAINEDEAYEIACNMGLIEMERSFITMKEIK